MLESFRTRHRVWLNDIDLLWHMNNGRYFTITDIVRIDWRIRAGMWGAMRERGYYSVIAGETIQFRKALSLFKTYEIRNRLIAWDEKYFYFEHQFISAGQICAISLVKLRVVGQRQRPSPEEVMSWYGEVPDRRDPDEVIKNWNQSTREQWRQLNRELEEQA